MIGTGIVEPLAVGDQHAEKRAELQQLVPVPIVAGQTGRVQAQHQPGLAEPNLSDQPLKAVPVLGRTARLAQVIVDHLDPLAWPAEPDRPVDQSVLQLGALLMVPNLAGAGLAHVDVRELGPMCRGDTLLSGRRRAQHESSPPSRCRAVRATSAEAAVPPVELVDAGLPPAASATAGAVTPGPLGGILGREIGKREWNPPLLHQRGNRQHGSTKRRNPSKLSNLDAWYDRPPSIVRP